MQRWSVAQAKAKLSEVIDRTREQPQVIESRGRPVAVVMSVERFERLREAEERSQPSPMQDFLRRCEALRSSGELELELPRRVAEPDRPAPFDFR